MMNKKIVSNPSYERKEIDNKVKTYNTQANEYIEDALSEADQYAKMHTTRMTHEEVFFNIREKLND